MSNSLDLLYKNLEYLNDQNKIDLPHYKLDNYKEGTTKLSVFKLLKISKASAYSVADLLEKDIAKSEAFDPAKIKLLVLDVDGVLTDASMNLTEGGDEFKRFNAKDGMAIKRSQKRGVETAIISNGSRGKAINHRADMLGIDRVYVGKAKKIEILEVWLNEMNLNFSQVAYIGDDLNDIEIMKKTAVSACPRDAAEDVKKIASINLSKNGGYGCVREFIEKYLLESLLD